MNIMCPNCGILSPIKGQAINSGIYSFEKEGLDNCPHCYTVYLGIGKIESADKEVSVFLKLEAGWSVVLGRCKDSDTFFIVMLLPNGLIPIIMCAYGRPEELALCPGLIKSKDSNGVLRAYCNVLIQRDGVELPVPDVLGSSSPDYCPLR